MQLPTLAITLITLAAFAGSTQAAPAPKAKDAKALVQNYMEKLRKGEGVDSSVFDAGEAGEVIEELKAFLVRGTSDEKRHAVVLISLVGRRSTDRAVRIRAVETILDLAVQSDRSDTNAVGLGSLRDFTTPDFSEKARTAIEKLVQKSDSDPYALWLVGLAGMENLKKVLAKVVGKDPGRGFFMVEPYWTANLALARLGDAESAKRCIDKMENERDVVQRVRGYPDLARTRHEVAAKYLVKIMNSDDELTPVRAGLRGTKVASHACDALARVVEGFPLKAVGPSYSDKELETARKWIQEQKTLKFKP